MIFYRLLAQINLRLRQIFAERGNSFFGGYNIILVSDFF